jgi:phosphoribosylglycinamide formyltransferase-1
MKISFLASHAGTAAKQIIKAIRDQQLIAGIGIVITNNRDSAIFKWCQENNIDVLHISGKTHPSEAKKDQAIHAALIAARTDLIVLSGYMKKIGAITLSAFQHRILNMHPALLPKHGGSGLYGDKVHQAVLDAGDRESGATVHYVNENYDDGPIISQQVIAVSPNETVASLKSKVQAIEGELYLKSIKQLIDDDLPASAFTLKGYVIVPKDILAAFIHALPKHVALSRKEAGCLSFNLTQDPHDIYRFNLDEIFVNQPAFVHHQNRVKNTAWSRLTSQIERHYEVNAHNKQNV